MSHKVRIIRKHKSSATMACNYLNLATKILRMVTRPQVQVNLDYMQEIRARKIQMDTQVAEMRQAKLANDLVLQDMKIEIMKAQLRSLGIGVEPFASEETHAQ